MSAPLGVVDVGGSHATAALVDPALELEPVLLSRRLELDSAASADEIVQALAGLMRDVAQRPTSWTIALPGPFDYARGTGGFEGVGKFAALAGVDLRGRLADAAHVEATDLAFVNDAEAYAIGEWWRTRPRAARFVCLTLGTGVGSAFLDQGRPVIEGPDVPPHGWVHLLSIEGRPLEEVVSTSAIKRDYRASTQAELSVADIAARARAGEASAIEVLRTAMARLGNAVGPWVDRFGATEVVIGGSMARSWDVLAPRLAAAFQRTAPRAATRPAVAVDAAPLIGAAVWSARERR